MSTKRIHVNRRVHPRHQTERPEPEPVGSPDICPRCGGQLRPTTGIHRILDPRLVCTTCGYLWSADEAIAGSWSRGDKVPEPPGAIGYPILLTAHLGCGSLLLLFLGFMWFVAEHHGWCIPGRDDAAFDKCIGLGYDAQDRSAFRLWVPLLAAAWLIIAWWMMRVREASCLSALATATILLALFGILFVIG